VNCAGVDHIGKGHLMNAAQALVVGVRNDLEHQRVIDGYESVNGIVDYFSG